MDDTAALAPLLAQHEAVIERGLQSFVEVGEALAAIRDQRLYRATYRNFDAYLQARWPELGQRNYAGKLIRAARVARELGTNVPILPSSEGQVRPLLGLQTPEDRQAAWAQACERASAGGRHQPAGEDVAFIVARLRPTLAASPTGGSTEAAEPASVEDYQAHLAALTRAIHALGRLHPAMDWRAVPVPERERLARALERSGAQLGAWGQAIAQETPMPPRPPRLSSTDNNAAAAQWGRRVLQNIRRLREARGWSPKELAQHSGLPVKTITALERGRITDEHLRAVSKAFGVPLGELLQ
jgi:DNA-binding XRE family transcriptional regulator